MHPTLAPIFAALFAIAPLTITTATETPTNPKPPSEESKPFKRGGPLKIEGKGNFFNNKSQTTQATNTSKEFLLISVARKSGGGGCYLIPEKYLIDPKETIALKFGCAEKAFFNLSEEPEEITNGMAFNAWIRYDSFPTKEAALASLTRDKKMTEFWTGIRDRIDPLVTPNAENARKQLKLLEDNPPNSPLPLGLEAIYEEYLSLNETEREALITELGNFTDDKKVPTEWMAYYSCAFIPKKKTSEDLGVKVSLAGDPAPITSLTWNGSDLEPKTIKFEVLPGGNLTLAIIELKSEPPYPFKMTSTDVEKTPTEVTITPEKAPRNSRVKATVKFVLLTQDILQKLKQGDIKTLPPLQNVLHFPVKLEKTETLKIVDALTSEVVESLLWDSLDMTERRLRVEVLPEYEAKLHTVEVVGIHNDNFEVTTKKINDRSQEVILSRKKGTRPWAMASARFSISSGDTESTQGLKLIIKDTKKIINKKPKGDDAEEDEPAEEDASMEASSSEENL